MPIRVKTQPTEQEIAKEQEMVELKKRVMILENNLSALVGLMLGSSGSLKQALENRDLLSIGEIAENLEKSAFSFLE